MSTFFKNVAYRGFARNLWVTLYKVASIFRAVGVVIFRAQRGKFFSKHIFRFPYFFLDLEPWFIIEDLKKKNKNIEWGC